MRWKASTVSQSSSKHARDVLLPAQTSPSRPDHADVEFGDLYGDMMKWGLMLMPSAAKALL